VTEAEDTRIEKGLILQGTNSWLGNARCALVPHPNAAGVWLEKRIAEDAAIDKERKCF